MQIILDKLQNINYIIFSFGRLKKTNYYGRVSVAESGYYL